jgi:hypothetical protein
MRCHLRFEVALTGILGALWRQTLPKMVLGSV